MSFSKCFRSLFHIKQLHLKPLTQVCTTQLCILAQQSMAFNHVDKCTRLVPSNPWTQTIRWQPSWVWSSVESGTWK